MNNNDTQNKSTYLYQITIIGILFAVFGFVTWLNGTLIPFLKKACELTDQQAFYVTTAFFIAYFFLAIPSSYIINRLGTKKAMVTGLLIMAVGCLVFIYAAQDRSYSIFLTGLFVLGTGLALLQTASNPYVSLIGPIVSAATRISIMGICNKFAGIAANLSFGALLLGNADEIQKQIDATTDPTIKNQLLDDLASRVETPYFILTAFLAIVAIIIYKSNLKDVQSNSEVAEDTSLSKGKTSVLQFPHVLLGALAIFVYVGAEVMAGDLIAVYGRNLGFSEDTAKFFSSFNLIGLLLGYVTSIILIPKYIKQETWLSVSAILGIILTIASYFTNGNVAVGCIAALGFANAVMWPAIFPLGIRDTGKFSNLAAALLVMGIAGGALIPPIYGWLYKEGNVFGLDFRSAFVIVMSICYIYIYWFGKSGHKVGFNKKL
jgi:MFS transporter, FHS family, L-fucose permease